MGFIASRHGEKAETRSCGRGAARSLPHFSRGTLAAMREADRLERDLQAGVVTREELVRTGRAFATVDDWLKSMA